MANRDDLLNLNDKKNIKKPLIYGAVAFLVFIIGVLGFAIYSNSKNKDENVVLPPQIKQEKQEQMFKSVPIEEAGESSSANSSKSSAETLTQKLLENEKKESNEKKEEKAVSQVKNQVKEIEKKSPPVAEKAAKKEIKTVKKEDRSKKDYYIQVAALLKYKKPNQKFLSLIKKEGYTYRLYHTYYVKNGKKIEVTKILIGPFTKNEAVKEMKNIKSRITQNAFLFKVK